MPALEDLRQPQCAHFGRSTNICRTADPAPPLAPRAEVSDKDTVWTASLWCTMFKASWISSCGGNMRGGQAGGVMLETTYRPEVPNLVQRCRAYLLVGPLLPW
eukprot:CAMPEP_0115754942 /NCGR_PEP_ID=MMETSP0272-20121206/97129_1 /TAXON_ID=71861 /ORGANISM="Scrippsiella trochoidea, Strain CCMP3099" /LENGTH=102 /DNA_ID=CAMNT_0003200363 /DNA_START=391 /DNA_END=696 /DNA_ORIENTATION=+